MKSGLNLDEFFTTTCRTIDHGEIQVRVRKDVTDCAKNLSNPIKPARTEREDLEERLGIARYFFNALGFLVIFVVILGIVAIIILYL